MSARSSAILAETLGSAALLAVVTGSGIMGERLAAGNAAVALLANAGATGAGLFVLITILAPISGAHLNPLVSFVMWRRGEIDGRTLFDYIAAQTIGAIAGVLLAHGMFDLPLVQWSTKARTGPSQWFSEIVATVGLLATILLGNKARPTAVPALVAAYIAAAYWFTASTSFANPAVTFARALSDTFVGIRPTDVPAFVIAQCLGAAIVLGVTRRAARVGHAHTSDVAQ